MVTRTSQVNLAPVGARVEATWLEGDNKYRLTGDVVGVVAQDPCSADVDRLAQEVPLDLGRQVLQ